MAIDQSPRVFPQKLAEEFFTPEGCFIIEVSNSPADEAVSIARARVEPAVTTRLHAVDGTEERYIIVSGKGRVKIGEALDSEVGPGDVVLIPAGVPQQITNTGSTDLIFYCVCTPRFRQSNYRLVE